MTRARQNEVETGVHAAVLAPCTDRFIRASDYNCKTNPDATPTNAEFCKLRELAAGVTLLTLLHPDVPPREVTSRRTKWGQQFKNLKGGGDRKPGWLKRRRERDLPKVLQLRRKGVSYGKIAKRLHVSSSEMVWRWANLCV